MHTLCRLHSELAFIRCHTFTTIKIFTTKIISLGDILYINLDCFIRQTMKLTVDNRVNSVIKWDWSKNCSHNVFLGCYATDGVHLSILCKLDVSGANFRTVILRLISGLSQLLCTTRLLSAMNQGLWKLIVSSLS